MSNPKYLALDCETGGLKGTSLLTAYLIVLDEELEPAQCTSVANELELALRPDDGIYRVQAEGLSINKIDLIAHDKEAEPKSVLGQELRNFLRAWSNDGAQKLTPLGHNVTFDVNLLKDQILSEGEINKYLRYRVLDTGGLACAFEAAGWVKPGEVSGGLESLVKFFGIAPQAYHTAQGDTLMTVAVAKRMLDVMKAFKKGHAESLDKVIRLQ